MEYKELVLKRSSEHAFLPDCKISEDEFYSILEAVKETPSGYNAQPWHFLLIQDSERLKDLQALCYNQEHVTASGNLIIVLGDVEFGVHEQDRICGEWKKFRDFDTKKIEALRASLIKDREPWKKREMMLRNVSLAAMSFLLSAENEGWATCPMMGFRQLDLRRFLELPENLLPVMLIALGKRDEKKSLAKMPRKNARDIGSIEHLESS